jgi:hypothetical protein
MKEHLGPGNPPKSLLDLTDYLHRLMLSSYVDALRAAFHGYFVAWPHHFFKLCQDAIPSRNSEEPREINNLPWDDWSSESGPFHKLLRRIGRAEECWACVQAHLLCARKAACPDFWPETGRVSKEVLEEIAKKTGLNRGFLHVLAAQLCGRPLPVERELTMPVLLVQDRGILADLTLKLIKPGCGDWYPAPAVSLIHLHDDFRKSQDAARQYVSQRLGWRRDDRDICWDLRPREGEWPAELKGPSASAATALLLAKLLAMSDGLPRTR